MTARRTNHHATDSALRPAQFPSQKTIGRLWFAFSESCSNGMSDGEMKAGPSWPLVSGAITKSRTGCGTCARTGSAVDIPLNTTEVVTFQSPRPASQKPRKRKHCAYLRFCDNFLPVNEIAAIRPSAKVSSNASGPLTCQLTGIVRIVRRGVRYWKDVPVGQFKGTRRFSSSSQFGTTTSSGGAV